MAQGRMQDIEAKEGKPMEEILKEQFRKHGTQVAVARALGVSQSTLNLWMLKLNLEQRTVLVKRNGGAA